MSGAARASASAVVALALASSLALSACAGFDLSSLLDREATPQPQPQAKQAGSTATAQRSHSGDSGGAPKPNAGTATADDAGGGTSSVAAEKRMAALRASAASAICERAGAEADRFAWTLRVALHDNVASAKKQYDTLSQAGYPVFLRQSSGGVVAVYSGRVANCWSALEAKRALDARYSLDTVIERAR